MELSDISDVIEDHNEDEESGDRDKSPDPQKELKQKKKSQLNNYVAITVVLFVTFMGVCKVKSDNVVQAMQKTQADRIDTWSFYQARNVRAEIAKSTIVQLKLQALALQAQIPQPNLRDRYNIEIAKEITNYEAIAAKQDKEKDGLQKQAQDSEKLYDQLNVHDDQFDLSEAAFALAIALLAMTSLTQKGWLYGAAMVPAAFGLFMGLAGLLNLDYHPDALTKLLSNNSVHKTHIAILPYPQSDEAQMNITNKN